MFAKAKAARQKRVETRNNRKVKVAEAKYAAQAMGYENGVDPSAGAKIGPIVQSGLGIVKGFLGQKQEEALPLPDAAGNPNSKIYIIGGAVAAFLALIFIMKKK